MSRGMLDDSDWEKYVRDFPDLSGVEGLVSHLPTLDFLSIPCLKNGAYQAPFPVASVCFSDTYDALGVLTTRWQKLLCIRYGI